MWRRIWYNADMIKTNRKIVSAMHRAIVDYEMLADGDKVAVGVSGGKDSLTLLASLAQYRRQVKYQFEIVAVAVDIFGNTDFEEIQKFCDELGVPLHIVRTEINKIVFDVRKEKNPCSLCANLRRGSLNSAAKELGCNKVALGHHADDLVETFFMCVAKENRLSTFWPKTYLSRINLHLIRPMIYVWENAIAESAKDYPVLFNPCKADKTSQRAHTKTILANLETQVPNFKQALHAAICKTERYNLFDKIKK